MLSDLHSVLYIQWRLYERVGCSENNTGRAVLIYSPCGGDKNIKLDPVPDDTIKYLCAISHSRTHVYIMEDEESRSNLKCHCSVLSVDIISVFCWFNLHKEVGAHNTCVMFNYQQNLRGSC